MMEALLLIYEIKGESNMAIEKTIRVVVQLKRDSLRQWEANNPILRAGEMSYVNDLGKCKIGDGKTPWIDLPYFLLETDQLSNIVIKTKEIWKQYDKVKSQRGKIYVYTEDDPNLNKSPLIKIGDGLAYICDLPFITDELSEQLKDHVQNEQIHISQIEREFWNNKVTCYLSNENQEQIIFDKY